MLRKPMEIMSTMSITSTPSIASTKTPRILLAFVTMNDAIYVDTVKSILNLDTTGLDVEHGWFTHSITSAARNCAAARCVGEKFDYLAFLDLDMTFDPQTLRRLVAHNVPIVSGMYRARRGDPGPFFAFNFHDNGIPQTITEIDMRGPELMEVQGLPTGCMLIKREVFEALDKHAAELGEQGPAPGQPYFWYEARLDRIRQIETQMHDAAATDGHVDADVLRFKPAFARGEDLRFCASCVEAGIKLYLDTRLVCGHLTVQSYGSPSIYD